MSDGIFQLLKCRRERYVVRDDDEALRLCPLSFSPYPPYISGENTFSSAWSSA